MKHTKYSKIIVLLLAFLAIGCNQYLDEEQELSTTTEDIDYSSEDGAFGATVGAYYVFQSVGWEQIPLLSVLGDDVNSGGLGDQQAFSDTDKFIYDNNYWMYNSLWETWFQDIIQVTAQIEQLEKFREGGVDSGLIDQYQAECKTIRAFQTLELSKLFGDVFKVVNTDPTTFTVQSKDDLMQWISDEMDDAIPHLLDVAPNLRSDLPGGVTKYTALAVKAMANQELGNYDAVAAATGQIISSEAFELYPDFYNLFKIPGKLCNENIWEIQYSDFGTGSGDNVSHLYAFYGPTSWNPEVSTATGGWGFYEPSLKYIKFMLDRDEEIRLPASVLFTPRGIDEIQNDPNYATLPSWLSTTTQSGDEFVDFPRAMFLSGKHYLPSDQLTPGRTAYGTNKNYTIIRYAEILLMYAEAVTRGGSATAGTADNAINQVRLRAGLGTYSGVTTQQVLDEKYAELGMEWGIRYYDMVRTENVSALSYDGRTFSMEKQFLPYPQAALDKSPTLREYYNSHQ